MAECALPACRSATPCRVCPYAFACPSCGMGPGRRCQRPSGHRCEIHEPRALKADRQAIHLHRDDVRDDLGEERLAEWCEKVGVA